MLQTRLKPEDLRELDLLQKSNRYTFVNLLSWPSYSPDAIEHLVRYYFPVIVSLHEGNEDIRDVYCDLTAAIKQLPELERAAVTLMVQGWKVRDTESGIGPKLGMSSTDAAKVLRVAYRHMSDFLEGRNREV